MTPLTIERYLGGRAAEAKDVLALAQEHGVPVQVDGVCMVKIDGTDPGIERAAEQFLSRGPEDIVRTAMQAVEGHMRSAIGALSIEDIYRDRQRLV